MSSSDSSGGGYSRDSTDDSSDTGSERSGDDLSNLGSAWDPTDNDVRDFNDIDGMFPQDGDAGEIGEYVCLEPTESDRDGDFYGRAEGSGVRVGPSVLNTTGDNGDLEIDDDASDTEPEAESSHARVGNSSLDETLSMALFASQDPSNSRAPPATDDDEELQAHNRDLGTRAASSHKRVQQIETLETQIRRESSQDFVRIFQFYDTYLHNTYGTMPGNNSYPPRTPQTDWMGCISCCPLLGQHPRPSYSALPGSSYTRVIILHPGTRDDLLYGTLEAIDLDDMNSRYEAISYQWGSRSDISEHPFILSGRQIWISNTIMSLLLHLRDRNRIRVLWIDALCINQSDISERNQQVGIMQKIYSHATRVIIHLGGENTRAKACFDAVKALTSAWLSFQKRQDIAAGSDQNPGWIYDPVIDKIKMSKIIEIFHNEYWTRLWVVQEIVSARLAIVHWGNAEISWTLVGLATALIRNNQRLWRMFKSLQTSSSAQSGLINAYLMYRLPSSRFRSSSMSFLDLLRLTRNFNVTVSLDRVYAVLGLPSQQTGPGRKFVTPDYGLLPRGLYTRVFHWVVTTHQVPLEILSAVRHVSLFCPDFPTWIPQWHVNPIRSIGASHRDGMKFQASAGGPENPPLQINWDIKQRSLTLNGLFLGSIKTSLMVVPSPLPETKKSRHQQLKKFNARLVKWCKENVPQNTVGRSMLSVTLTAGQDWSGGIVKGTEAQERQTRWFVKWARRRGWKIPLVSEAPHAQPGDGEVTEYNQTCQNVCHGRKLFAMTTRKGTLIGLGPNLVKPGDIVCVFLGGPVPYVLRPLGNGQCYFVGECYVPGYMFGELIQQWRAGDIPLQRFILR